MDLHYDAWLSSLDLLSQSNLTHILIYPAIPLMIYHLIYPLISGCGFYHYISSCNICHLAIFLLLFHYTMKKHFSKYTKYTGTAACFCVNFACFAYAMNLSPESSKYFVICSSVITLRSDFIIYSTRLIGIVMKVTMLIMWYYMDYLNGTFSISSLLNTILPTLFILWVGYFSDCNIDKIFRRIYNYQQAIEVERLKLGNLLRSIPDSLVVVEKGFSIELVNDYFREVFQVFDPNQVEDLLKDLAYYEARRVYPYNQESLAFYEDVLHFMNSGPSDSVLFGTVKHKDKFFEWRGSKTRWSSSNSIILISREVTSTIHLEISRSESKSKTAMLRSVSHELRTPTGTIASLSENMLELPSLPGEVRSDLEVVRVCAKLLLNLINDLLDYSQLMTGTFSVCKRHFEFRPFLQECSSLLKIQTSTRKLDFITSIDDNIPEVIFSDPDRLRQIVLNLLSNSLKFTLHGFIKITAKLKQGMLKISVADSGIGIPAEKISMLFQIFGKIENAEMNPQGRGLGLHISNMLARALGGPHMKIKSKEGIGTQVKFEIEPFENAIPESTSTSDIPYSRSMNESAFTRIVPNFPSKFFDSTERHAVLIVDDNDFNRSILGGFIREIGFKFDEACNGAEAVKMVQEHNSSDNPYKIVIMDCDMPVMNGWKASHKIHKMFLQGKIQTLPYIIGCTAYSSKEVSSKCLEAGMICHVEKPIGKKMFTNLLKEYIL